MGVRGLYSFIQEYSSDCLQPWCLRNCVVVLDGLNVAHRLQAGCKGMNAAMGGDYDKYANFVSDFFDTFQECGITPIVLLDGSCTSQKLKTVLDRTKERIRQCLHCTPVNQNKVRLFPLLGVDVFVSVMRRKNIKYMQCEKEADGDMVHLARQLNAPVISNDSDFYVYSVQYIPLHSLEMDPVKDDIGSYLQCLQFDCGKFLQRHGVDRVKLPLFAALVGNDYVFASQFEAMYACMKQRRKRKQVTAQHHKIWTILNWLRYQEDLEVATERVLQFMKADEREKGRAAIHRGMDEYLESVAQEDPKNEDEVMDSLMNQTWSNDGCAIPDWFVRKFRQGRLPRFCLDILLQHFAILKPQVECFGAVSSFFNALNILLKLGWILLGDDKERCKLTLYIRRKDRLAVEKFNLTEMPEICTGTPTLSSLDAMSVGEKKEWLFRVLQEDFDAVDDFPRDVQLYLLAVLYWIKVSKQRLNAVHAISITVCFLFLYVIEGRIQLVERNIKTLEKLREAEQFSIEENPEEGWTFEEILSKLTRQECIAAKCILTKYLPLNPNLKVDSARYFEKHYVHSFSNLQAILQVITCLNGVLGEIFPTPEVEHLLGGTLFYNICSDLFCQRDAERYVVGMCKGTAVLGNLFKFTYGRLKKRVQPANTEKSRNKKGKRKKISRQGKEPDLENQSDTEDSEEKEASEVCAVDVDNKFSAISNCDS